MLGGNDGLVSVFVRRHKIRMGVVAAAVTLALMVFRGVGAVLGKTPLMRFFFLSASLYIWNTRVLQPVYKYKKFS